MGASSKHDCIFHNAGKDEAEKRVYQVNGAPLPNLFTRLGIDGFQLQMVDLADPKMLAFAEMIVSLHKAHDFKA